VWAGDGEAARDQEPGRKIRALITRAFRRKRPRYKFGFIFFRFAAFSHKTHFNYSACVTCRRMRKMNPRAHGLNSGCLKNSSLDINERNSMAIALNIHRKSHTVRGRSTLKLVQRFGRSANFTRDPFTSSPLRMNLLSRNIKRKLHM